MQPYGRRDRAALKYLHDLQNFDKHRTLHVIVTASRGAAFWGDLDLSVNFGPLKHGDVLAEAPLARDDEPDQNPNFTYGVAFDQSGPGAKAGDVVTALAWIGWHIEDRVIQPLLTFL